jgi:hypothetical protein
MTDADGSPSVNILSPVEYSLTSPRSNDLCAPGTVNPWKSENPAMIAAYGSSMMADNFRQTILTRSTISSRRRRAAARDLLP